MKIDQIFPEVDDENAENPDGEAQEKADNSENDAENPDGEDGAQEKQDNGGEDGENGEGENGE